MIKALLDEIDPCVMGYHDLDGAKVQAIAAAMEAGKEMAPILVVDCGNEFLVLDGHHRAAAARQLRRQSIQAYVVENKDFDGLLAEKFDGEMPCRLSDLDEYIEVGGAAYDGREE